MVVEVEIVERVPTVDEHRALFAVEGWTWYGEAVTRHSLAGTVHGVVAVRDGTTVGMGRVVGDGGAFHYVQDLVVVPELRGHGVGAALLARLLDRIRHDAPGGSVVGVFSTSDAVPLYRRFGFGEPELTALMAVVTPR